MCVVGDLKKRRRKFPLIHTKENKIIKDTREI